LPVGKIVVEIANFDIQKIKNPDIKGAEYQQGDQLGFWNVRAFVLHRDGHICRCCKGKSGDKILNVHHIESRLTGGDAPNNLITLCETCHKKFHRGEITLEGVERGNSYKAETFMGLVRNYLYKRLKDEYKNVKYTYGYITKSVRIENKLNKDHYIDARCISGNPLTESNDVYKVKKVRCHNRQLHTAKYNKRGVRDKRSSPFITNGFRAYDKVEIIVKGVVKRGFIASKIYGGNSVEMRDINGKIIGRYVCKKLKLLDKRKNFIFEKCDINH
jgi:N6-L-threonylcarbamoyladenine synthase